MDIQKLIQETMGQGDTWVVMLSAVLAALLLFTLLIYFLFKAFRKRKGRKRVPAPASVLSTETPQKAESTVPEKRSGEAPSAPETRSKDSGASAPNAPGAGASDDLSWMEEARVRPVAMPEGASAESRGFVARDESSWEERQQAIPAAWRTEQEGMQGKPAVEETLAPILDLASQRVDSALIGIPEYPLSVGSTVTSTHAAPETVAISREDGLFDIYKNVPFLRAHLKTGLDAADLFFIGPGGEIAVNCHPFVLFQPEFAHDPDIRRRTESILQTAASGYMHRGLDRLAPIEKEALPWTIRFLFWKGRLDKALSLLYRFNDDFSSETHRIRALLAAAVEDPVLHAAYPVSSEGATYDRALLGIPSETMAGLRTTVALQGATDTEDFSSLRPFEDLDRRNARWLYLYLLHRGHLFSAFRLALALSRLDRTFEDELLYIAGIQGRNRLLLRTLFLVPSRNTFFRLSALKHALANLKEEERSQYLEKLRKHWPQATDEALNSVEPFAEFQGADMMRRNPGNILSSVANPLDRSALLDWMDLAAYRSRAGFHSGALNRASVLLYTILSGQRPARSGFRERAERFLERASLMSNVARHYHVLWLRDTHRWSEARQQAEYFVRRYPDLTYFHQQFLSLSRQGNA